MKKVLCLVMAFLMVLGCINAFAEETEKIYGDFVIVENEDNITITRVTQSDLINVTVPGEINGKKVALAPNLFEGMASLESVIIEEGIVEIPENAFHKCINLKSVKLPDTLETISGWAFRESGLNEIILPDRISTIGASAFYGTTITKVRIPDNVTTVGNYAFSGCAELIFVDLNNVEIIGQGAFSKCTKLEKVTHNGKLTELGAFAFENCPVLNEIDIKNVKIFDTRVFNGNQRIEYINLQNIEKAVMVEDRHIQGEENPQFIGEWYKQSVGVIKSPLGYSSFSGMEALKTARVNLSNYKNEGVGVLFFDTPNLQTIIYENFSPAVAGKWLCHEYDLKKPRNENIVLYGNEDIKAYAESLGVSFKELTDVELNDEHYLNLGDFETETSKVVVEEAGRVVNTITDKWVIDRIVGYIASISGTQGDFDTNDEDVIRLTLYPNETSLIKDKIMVIEKVPGNYRTSIKIYTSDMELLDERYYVVYGSLETYLRQAGIRPIHMDGTYKNITWNLTKEGVLTLNGTGTTAKDRDSDAWVDAWVKELVIGEGITVADGFGYHENLEKITFPSTLETIEALSFTCCNKLEKVVIPENVSLIRIMAFDECENLKEVTVTSKVPLKIERSAFDIADGSVIHLPDTVYDIQEHAFTDTFPVMHGDYGCFDEDCDIIIDAPLGSYAYNWAVENDFKVTDSKSDAEVIDGVPFEDKSDLKEEAVIELKENTLSREELFDQIEALANKNGLTVYRNGDSLAVQNGSSYFAISNDKVAYMENGLLAEENIYVDGAQVKYPEDAIDAFFAIGLNGKTISDIIAE